MQAKSLQSCLTLCNPMDCSPPCSFVHGILQARILEWIATSSSRDLPKPGVEPASFWSLTSPALAGRLFTTSTTGFTYCHIQLPTGICNCVRNICLNISPSKVGISHPNASLFVLVSFSQNFSSQLVSLYLHQT